MKITEIKLNPDNPRFIRDDRFQKLKDNIKAFPKMMKLRPIVVDDNGIILGGNMRYRALTELGYDDLPDGWVVKASELTEDEKRRFIITDNIGYGEFDMDLLANEWDLEELQEWGVELGELDTQLEEAEEDDFDVDNAIEETKEPICKLGDIWQLGNHRIMCGDSTKKEDVEKLMNGKKADMVFTDPPYNVDYDGGVIHGSKINKNHKRDKLLNDDTDIYSKFISILPLIIDNGAIYIFYATRNSYEVFKPLKENNIRIMSVIAWIKINTGYADMNSHYKNRYEPIIYCGIGEKTNFIGDTSENTTWEIEKDRNNNLHPTQKPITVPFRAIKNHDAKIVADLFLGSGSTLIACEQLNRICYGMEIDPIYCDVVIRRWEDYTGKKAVKL